LGGYRQGFDVHSDSETGCLFGQLVPPMGWSSWNTFVDVAMNETVIRETANAMVSSGLKDLGYEYINIGMSVHVTLCTTMFELSTDHLLAIA
jgi:hypothetical protein